MYTILQKLAESMYEILTRLTKYFTDRLSFRHSFLKNNIIDARDTVIATFEEFLKWGL